MPQVRFDSVEEGSSDSSAVSSQSQDGISVTTSEGELEYQFSETLSNTISTLIAGPNPALSLYIDEASREYVRDFFVNLMGSEELALPILHYAEKNGVPLLTAFSLSYIESRFNPYAVNFNAQSVDRGLFQLNSRSFPNLTELDFFDPDTNARYGIEHLKFCLELGENEVVALAMYNAGHNRVVKVGTPQITLNYIAKFMNYRNKLNEDFREYMLSFINNHKKTFSKAGKIKNQGFQRVDIKKSVK